MCKKLQNGAKSLLNANFFILNPKRSIRSHDDENSTDESGSCTPRKRPAEAMDFKIKYKTEVNLLINLFYM